MAWDLSWLVIRLLLIFGFLGIGFSLALRLWRQGEANAAICPTCGTAAPLSRTKPHQHCRACGRALVENHELLPGVWQEKVGTQGRRR